MVECSDIRGPFVAIFRENLSNDFGRYWPGRSEEQVVNNRGRGTRARDEGGGRGRRTREEDERRSSTLREVRERSKWRLRFGVRARIAALCLGNAPIHWIKAPGAGAVHDASGGLGGVSGERFRGISHLAFLINHFKKFLQCPMNCGLGRGIERKFDHEFLREERANPG
jgi:hypothetical protein